MGTLVRQARRRILGNELLAQGTSAASVALAAFILLLLLGTQILSWQIALALPLIAAAASLYRIKRRLPSPYAVAQLVDRRLDLADNLSTALFFHEGAPGAPAPPMRKDFRQAQFESAGRVAASIDVRLAVPYKMPRGLYVMAALLLVATSLFALRYGLSRRLDLKQPLANFLPESLSGGKNVRQADNARRNPKKSPEAPGEGVGALDQDQKAPGQQNANPEMQTAGESESLPDAKTDSKSSPGQKSSEQGDNQMASDDQDSQSEGNAGKSGEENQSGQQGDSKSGQSDKPQPGSKQDSNANDNSSLMSKMKDAFQNLLSKVKPQQNQQGSPQQGNQEQNSRQGKAQQGQKGQNNKDGQQQNGNQQGDAQEGEDGQEAKNSDNAQQGKGQGKSDSQQSSKQPGSGIGSQDGDKAIKNAEQLAAMGKISEILGKRSATISGEATVEVRPWAVLQASREAEGLAADDGYPGHFALGDGIDEAGACPLDPVLFRFEADHKPGVVHKDNHREVEGVAELDEARGLFGRGDVHGATHSAGVVEHHANRVAVRAGEADDAGRAVVGRNFEE